MSFSSSPYLGKKMGFPATAGNQLQKEMESALLIHNPLKWPFNVALSFFPDPLLWTLI